MFFRPEDFSLLWCRYPKDVIFEVQQYIIYFVKSFQIQKFTINHFIAGSQEIQLITSRTESILKSLIANYSKWELAQERGLALCRNIEAKKTKCLQNNGSDLYPNEIESYCSKLKRLLDIFKDISSDADESYRNLKALQKLNKCSEDPLFWTCSLENLLNYCGNIRETYSAEVKTKLKIIGKHSKEIKKI